MPVQTTTLKPEKELKSLWYISWAIPFVIGVVVLLALLLATREQASVVLGFVLVGFLVVMFLILLWLPVYYGSLEYVIDAEAVRSKGGVFWKKYVTIPFRMITHVDVTQGPVERALGIGTIHVQTAGAGGPEASKAELKLAGMRDLEQVKESVMERMRGFGAPSQPPGAEPEAAVSAGVPQVLERMLEELEAIRGLLEKRRS
jgi:membrane protein YdbS with pleckstrin-like domain